VPKQENVLYCHLHYALNLVPVALFLSRVASGHSQPLSGNNVQVVWCLVGECMGCFRPTMKAHRQSSESIQYNGQFLVSIAAKFKKDGHSSGSQVYLPIALILSNVGTAY